jgi:hypothetical protein
MQKHIVPLVTASVLMAASVVRAAEPAELQPLAFLVGEWESAGAGDPGSGAGTAAFRWDLQDHVILRTSFAEYPAAGVQPASRHDDLMVIYVSSAALRADYYDSEGHVIRYSVRSPAPGQAVFLSEPLAGEPTYRLTYTQASNGTVDGRFEIADPGTTVFKSYLAWHSRKVTKGAELVVRSGDVEARWD